MQKSRSVFLLFLATLCAPQSLVAAPTKAIWSPAVVNSVVYAGETIVIEVSVELTGSAKNLSLWVVPELQPFVSISPTGIADVGAGEYISFEMEVSVDDAAAPQIVDGTVHLRSGKKTMSRPLPVKLDLQWPNVAGPGGVVISFPGTFYAEVDPGSEAVLLWDKTAKPAVPESDAVGFISVDLLRNPSGEPIEQIFDGNPGPDLGSIQSAVDVDGRTGFEYRPTATLGGDRVVVVPTADGFVQFSEIGSAFEADGPFDQVIEAVKIPN